MRVTRCMRMIWLLHTCDMTFPCATWLIQMSDITYAYMCHGWFICVTGPMRTCDMTLSYLWRDFFMYNMTHSNVWHDWCICVPWLIHSCDMTPSFVWHDSIKWVTWLILICDVTNAYVCHMCDMPKTHVYHDSFRSATWLIQKCYMTPPPSDESRDIFIHVTRLNNMCGMSHSYECDMTNYDVCHDWFRSVAWPPLLPISHALSSYTWRDSIVCAASPIHVCVTWLIQMCAMTHSEVLHDSPFFIPITQYFHTRNATRIVCAASPIHMWMTCPIQMCDTCLYICIYIYTCLYIYIYIYIYSYAERDSILYAASPIHMCMTYPIQMFDSCDWQDWGLTLEALPPRGGGSAGCPKKGQEESETGE